MKDKIKIVNDIFAKDLEDKKKWDLRRLGSLQNARHEACFHLPRTHISTIKLLYAKIKCTDRFHRQKNAIVEGKKDEKKINMNDLTHEYKSWISELKTRYKQAQIKASVAVNGELLKFYFDLGKDISEKQFANSYGSAFYKTLSSDLITEFPDAKGFSPTNLKYSFYFYDLYKAEFQNRPQVVDDLCRIPWGHHRFIIDKIKNDSKKALFYVEQIIQNNWSRNVLLNFIDSNLYERQGKAVTNFSQKLSVPAGDLAQQITKDPYSFDFLSLRTDYDEKELKDWAW